VEDQASNIDDTPTNNMDMERLMGKTDYRLQKLQTLSAASRSIVLQKTKVLRKASQDSNFRDFRKQVKIKREKELEWNEKQREKFRDDAERKQEVAIYKCGGGGGVHVISCSRYCDQAEANEKGNTICKKFQYYLTKV
jgi:hypothetical protein